MQKKDDNAMLRTLFYRYLGAWKWFALSVFVCLFIGVIFIKTVSPIYEINANVLIKAEDGGGAGMKGSSMLKSFGLGMTGSMDVQDEYYVMNSYSLMRKTVDSLSLYKSYIEKKYLVKSYDRYGKSAFDVLTASHIQDTLTTSLLFKLNVDEGGKAFVKVIEKETGEIYSKSDVVLPATIHLNYGDFKIVTTDKYIPNKSYKYRIRISGLDVVAEDYQKNVEVSIANKKANVINLYTKGANTAKCYNLLNKMIALYNEDAMYEKNLLASSTGEFIKTRLDLMSLDLSEAETQVENFKKTNHLFNLEQEASSLYSQNTSVQKNISDVEVRLSILDKLKDYLMSEDHKYDLLPMASGLYDDNSLASASEYNKVVMDRLRILQNSTKDNPAIKILDNQIEALRKSVLTSFHNVAQGLMITKQELQLKNSEFANRYKDAPTLEKHFIDIKRTQSIKEQLVVFLMEKREENALALAANAPKARIIDAAFQSSKPVFPKTTLTLVIAFLLGIAFPIIFMYLKDVLTITFKSKEELESLTTLPIIGEVCHNHTNKNIVVDNHSVSSITELFRLIRTNIQFILTHKTDKVIMVTSTRSGEGKSFVTINLALSLAVMNKKTLLIGMDIRKPRLGTYLDFNTSKKGVSNYLSDEDLTFDDIINYGVIDKNMDLILAGPIPPNPGELLLNNRLDELLEYCRSRYDYIIIDSAPVGMVSDSFALNRISDLVLYVMRANYTEKNVVSFVENVYKEKRFKKLYIVLNDTTTKKGYGYGYGEKESH